MWHVWFSENYGSNFKLRLNLFLFCYTTYCPATVINFTGLAWSIFDSSKLNKSCTNVNACPKIYCVFCSQNKIAHPPFNIKFILYRCLKLLITNCIMFNETLLKKLKNSFLVLINTFRIHMQLLIAACRYFCQIHNVNFLPSWFYWQQFLTE